MVVSVQKQQIFSFQNQKNSVEQFHVFGQVVQIVKSNQFWSKSLWRANRPKQSVFSDHWDQLLNQQQKQNQRNRSQDQVVQLKQKGQFHRSGVESSQ